LSKKENSTPDLCVKYYDILKVQSFLVKLIFFSEPKSQKLSSAEALEGWKPVVTPPPSELRDERNSNGRKANSSALSLPNHDSRACSHALVRFVANFKSFLSRLGFLSFDFHLKMANFSGLLMGFVLNFDFKRLKFRMRGGI